MGYTWVVSAPDGPQVDGPMNLAIRERCTITPFSIWRLWYQKQGSKAETTKRIPRYPMGYNYLSIHEIPVSDTKVLICFHSCGTHVIEPVMWSQACKKHWTIWEWSIWTSILCTGQSAFRLAWWRHHMDMLSALLAFNRVANAPITGAFRSQRDKYGSLVFSMLSKNKSSCWTYTRVAGDIRRHDAHVTSL